MCEKSIPYRDREVSISVQNLGKEVISRPRIRIMSASMKDTPVHEGVSGVGVSGVGVSGEVGEDSEAGADPDPDADGNEDAP